MYRYVLVIVPLIVLSVSSQTLGNEEQEKQQHAVESLKAEINVLHQQMEKQRKEYDARLRELQNRLQKLESSKVTNKAEKLPTAGTDTIEAELQRLSADEITELAPKPGLLPGLERAYQSLNPDISVIIVGLYHNDDTKEGIS